MSVLSHALYTQQCIYNQCRFQMNVGGIFWNSCDHINIINKIFIDKQYIQIWLSKVQSAGLNITFHTNICLPMSGYVIWTLYRLYIGRLPDHHKNQLVFEHRLKSSRFPLWFHDKNELWGKNIRHVFVISWLLLFIRV
jgi:hypothetical protein